MTAQYVDHYGATYADYAASAYANVRRQAFGEDIGQTGWMTAAEHDAFLSWLGLAPGRKLLDVASGSGGPAIRAALRTGCDVTGIDIHQAAVETATIQTTAAGVAGRVRFRQADAAAPLPFEGGQFDAIICVDAINHLRNRAHVLAEWARVLKPGGHLVYSDPVVITGAVTSEELAVRASIGFFLFLPAGMNEVLLRQAGFAVQHVVDGTPAVASMASRWAEARDARSDELRAIEGEATFRGQQVFFRCAAQLAEEARLSRHLFSATLSP